MQNFKLAMLITISIIFNKIAQAQCPADLTVTNGNTGTWVNNTTQVATVTITAIGAGGGKNTGTSCTNPTTAQQGGTGATIVGTFLVGPGKSLFLIAGAPGGTNTCGGGGGGASGVVDCGNPSNCGTGTILLIAGGGAGTTGFGNGPGGNITNGSGNGGTVLNVNQAGAGGGGLNSNGGNSAQSFGGSAVSKTSISLGGAGATFGGAGGNGMGAGGGAFNGYAGGGGGYSGGNGEDDFNTAGGGFSYNSGTSQINTAGVTGGGDNIGSVTVQCISTVLPVKLISFTGSNEINKNKLTWQTATETGNAYFEIQRSIDGINFENIGEVAGNGNSSVKINYDFIDDKYTSSSNYYRLKQYDIDSKFEYSNTILINSNKTNAISLFPNPSFETTFLSVSKEYINSKVELFSIEGKLISTFRINDNQQQIDISNLAKGIYALKFKDGNTLRLIKK